MLLGIQAGTVEGVQALAFYLATYTFTVAGSFGVATVVGRRGDNAHDLSHYRGLGRRAPLLAFAFLVFLLAQAGVPFTSGFLAKFYVIGAAVDARSFWLGLVAMLSSVISAYAYLKVVLAMYGEEPATDAPTFRVPPGARVALVVAVAATVGFGLVPGPLTDVARTAASTIVDAPVEEPLFPVALGG
jgi:NADH-quinone oxidoreductase subunit N